jgi:hypothetical protein
LSAINFSYLPSNEARTSRQPVSHCISVGRAISRQHVV